MGVFARSTSVLASRLMANCRSLCLSPPLTPPRWGGGNSSARSVSRIVGTIDWDRKHWALAVAGKFKPDSSGPSPRMTPVGGAWGQTPRTALSRFYCGFQGARSEPRCSRRNSGKRQKTRLEWASGAKGARRERRPAGAARAVARINGVRQKVDWRERRDLNPRPPP